MHLSLAARAATCVLFLAAGFAAAPPVRAADDAVLLRSGTACLEVFEPQLRVNGARVQAGGCSARPTQLWRLQDTRVVHVASGRCLELHAPDAGFPGARLQLADCRTTPIQSWSRDRGQLVAQADRRCVELQAGDTRVQSADCAATPAQQWVAEAPAGLREVEAGPIWNNADATQKCPAVCAPQAWTGAWRTTITGQMSVCTCTMGSVVVPVVASRAMSAERFDALLRAMQAEAFARSQLGVLEAAARDNLFEIEQLRRLLAGFSFPSDRVRAVEIVAPRIVDRGNAFLLQSALEFESEKSQVRAIFDKLR